jgi:SAM-dependent methyltransferase
MMDGDAIAYWNQEGPTKTFSHPVNMDWLREHLRPEARILDYGCGYGRVAALLDAEGYRDVVGVDASSGMIDKARVLHPRLSFQQIAPPIVPFPDDFFDAVLLFAVLTCILKDADQQAVIAELRRVTRPGGLLYVSDYWLQTDQRNRERYDAHFETALRKARGTEEVVEKSLPIGPNSFRQPPPSPSVGPEKCLPFGVFEVAEGVAVRHHSRQWIAELLSGWDNIAATDIQITTMNGHETAGFQWLGRIKE